MPSSGDGDVLPEQKYLLYRAKLSHAKFRFLETFINLFLAEDKVSLSLKKETKVLSWQIEFKTEDHFVKHMNITTIYNQYKLIKWKTIYKS